MIAIGRWEALMLLTLAGLAVAAIFFTYRDK
jgi:hypothetical protein